MVTPEGHKEKPKEKCCSPFSVPVYQSKKIHMTKEVVSNFFLVTITLIQSRCSGDGVEGWTWLSVPLCLPRKPCATFRPFDSSGAGRGSIEAFRSGSSIHSPALTTAITHRAGRRGGSYIYLTPRAVTFLSLHWQLLQKKVSINDI